MLHLHADLIVTNKQTMNTTIHLINYLFIYKLLFLENFYFFLRNFLAMSRESRESEVGKHSVLVYPTTSLFNLKMRILLKTFLKNHFATH